jgi:hypothetical protein
MPKGSWSRRTRSCRPQTLRSATRLLPRHDRVRHPVRRERTAPRRHGWRGALCSSTGRTGAFRGLVRVAGLRVGRLVGGDRVERGLVWVAAWCEVRVAAGLLWCRGHGGPAFAFGGDGSPIRYPKPWLTIHWILRPHASRSHRVPGDSHATERQSALTDAHVVRSGSRIFAQKPVRTRARAVRWSAQVDPASDHLQPTLAALNAAAQQRGQLADRGYTTIVEQPTSASLRTGKLVRVGKEAPPRSD